jgi:hypothetical protein
MVNEPLVTPLELAADAETSSEISVADVGQLVVVYTAGTPSEGEIVRGILESEGIAVVLTQAASPILGQVFSVAEGQAGEVLVSPEDADRAEAIVAAYTNQSETVDA